MMADRWCQSQEKTVLRLRELISVLENPEIEDGAQIKLRGNDFSQLRRVVEKKAVKAVAGNESELSMLGELRLILGDDLG